MIHPLTPLRRSRQRLGIMMPLQPPNRSYTSNKDQQNSSGQPVTEKGVRRTHMISTLTPDRITSSDYLDASSRRSLTIRFPGSSGLGTRIHFHRPGITRQPFPENTAGFLYYDRHPHAAPLEGSIRLRVTPDNAPASFPRGQDLCLSPGIHWQISLPQIAVRSDFTNLRDQLLHENLVPPEQLSRCRRIFAKSTRISPPATIFRLDQDFPLELSTASHITVVGKRLHTLRANFFEARVDNKTKYPWSGTAIVRFEPSTSPQHAGRRVVNLRIVQLITPVLSTIKGYRGRIFRPEEGELLTVSHRGGPPEPFGYDIDRHTTTTAVALRDLWDHSKS